MSALLIAATVHPASRLVPWLLGFAVFVWIGVRSYGIYLWHWPIYMVTRPHADVPLTGHPAPRAPPGAHVRGSPRSRTGTSRSRSATARSSAGGRSSARRTGETRRQLRHRVRRRSAIALVAGMLVIVVGLGDGGRTGRPGRASPTQAVVVLKPTTTTVDRPRPTTVRRPARTGGHHHDRPRSPVAGHVTAIGDSVMLGAADQLLPPSTPVGRRPGRPSTPRRAGSSPAGVDKIAGVPQDTGQLGQDVVVQLGTNGTVDPERLRPHDGILAERRQEGRDRQRQGAAALGAAGQRTLADGVKRYKNAVLSTGTTIAGDHPEFFWDDGIHLRPEGAAVLRPASSAQATSGPGAADRPRR